MTATAIKSTATKELTITRIYNAPRALVFKMWVDPKHMAQWWGPRGFSNPVCELDARVGGKIWIVMRGPKGSDYDMDFPMSGTFQEIVEPERLVFTAVAEDKQGNPLLRAHTTVTFEDIGGKTKLTLHASAVGLAPAALQMLAGMEAGWNGSLDQLAELCTREV
jgi:uncharacterized protein YndB with AHSA1/START domain